jgi:hypothetical protein
LAFPVRTLKPMVGTRQFFPAAGFLTKFFRQLGFLTGASIIKPSRRVILAGL